MTSLILFSFFYFLGKLQIKTDQKEKADLVLSKEKAPQSDDIDNLSDDEKQLLRRYIDKQVVRLDLPKDDTVVIGLVKKKILSPYQIYFSFLPTRSFTISKWALSYLEKFPEKLI